MRRTPKMKLSYFYNLLFHEFKLFWLFSTFCTAPQSFPAPGLPSPRNSLRKPNANAICPTPPKHGISWSNKATKKWVVTTSQRGKPGPIEPDRQHKQQQLYDALPPSYFPWSLTTSNSKTLIFIEEVKPFHLNAEKVALKAPGKQRRGMEPTQNRGVSAPQGAREPPPSRGTLQHPPGSRGPGRGRQQRKEKTLGPAGDRGERRRGEEEWGLEGRSSRGRGALCGVWAGVAVLTRGGKSGAGGRSRGPQTSLPRRGGGERREGGPSASHQHEARVGRRRTTLREGEGPDGKLGRPLSSPRRLPDSVGSRMG